MVLRAWCFVATESCIQPHNQLGQCANEHAVSVPAVRYAFVHVTIAWQLALGLVKELLHHIHSRSDLLR